MKKNINPVEFHATDHAIQRLNERFNVTKDESGKWVRRFLNDAIELTDDTGEPDCKYFKKGQCIAVVDIKRKHVITVYQQMPAKELRGIKSNLSTYIRPFSKKIGRHYSHDLNNRLYVLFSKLFATIVQMQLPSKRLQSLKRIKKVCIEIEQNVSDAIDDLETLKKL